MKKTTGYFAVIGMIISLCGCMGSGQTQMQEEQRTDSEIQMEPQTAMQQETEDEYVETVIKPVVQPNERTLHNADDMEKDRFLAFLNDEIPVANYPSGEQGVVLYYGDFRDKAWENPQDEPCYGIMDVTGDGENEYVFYNGDTAVCMAYDEETEQFDCLFLWDTRQTFWLGQGRVLCFSPGETNVYTYLVYDEGTLTESKKFAITLAEDAVIRIDDEDVTEERWKEEFDWIMDLYHTRPAMLTLEELLQ